MRSHTFAFAFLLSATPLVAQKAPDVTPYLMPDRSAEVALARSAAPASVSAKASVLVLTRTGYVEAEKGSNGFTCVVMRSFAAAPDDPHFWDPTILAPNCFNPPAVRTVLPGMLARMSWSLAGVSPTEIKARVKQAYAAKTFGPPAPGAMTYMLSPKQHLSDTDPHWMPHLMFYYDRTLTGNSFGAGDEALPIIDATGDSKDASVQVILIPVRTWSDGTAATHLAAKGD